VKENMSYKIEVIACTKGERANCKRKKNKKEGRTERTTEGAKSKSPAVIKKRKKKGSGELFKAKRDSLRGRKRISEAMETTTTIKKERR